MMPLLGGSSGIPSFTTSQARVATNGGTKGKLISKLLLKWAFRRAKERKGPEKGFARWPIDLGD